MSKIGIVTVLFNSDSVIDGFFESLSLQHYQNFIVYLIDNSYSEESEKLINQLIDKYNLNGKIEHVINQNNAGVAKGNNQGIELALKNNCSYVLLANNDIEFSQVDLFGALIEKTEKFKIVAPKILYHNTNKIWFAGGHVDRYRGLAVHEHEFEENFSVKEHITPYAPTCFMLLSSDVFETVGLMDEKYFVYWDDTDFIVRAKREGFNILYLPEYIIYHKVSISTGGRASLFSTYYFLRNRLYFIKKHFNGLSFYSSILYTYLTSLIKVLLYDGDRRKTILKALKDFKEM